MCFGDAQAFYPKPLALVLVPTNIATSLFCRLGTAYIVNSQQKACRLREYMLVIAFNA